MISKEKIKLYLNQLPKNRFQHSLFLFLFGAITTLFLYLILFSNFLQKIEITFGEKEIPIISVVELETIINSDHEYQLIDIRENHEYEQEHIKNAINIPLGSLWEAYDSNKIQTTHPVIIYDNDNYRVFIAYQELTNGKIFLENILVLDGGIKKWITQKKALAGNNHPNLKYIDLAQLKTIITENPTQTILDFRTAEEFTNFSFPNSINLTIETINFSKLQNIEKIYIISSNEKEINKLFQENNLSQPIFIKGDLTTYNDIVIS